MESNTSTDTFTSSDTSDAHNTYLVDKITTRRIFDIFKAVTCLPSEWLFTLLYRQPGYAKELNTLKQYANSYQSPYSDDTTKQNVVNRINKFNIAYGCITTQPFYNFLNSPLKRSTCVENINWEIFRVQPVRFMMYESFTTQCILAACTLTHFYTTFNDVRSSQYGKILMGKLVTPPLPLTHLPIKDLVKVSPTPFKLSWIFYLNVCNLGYMYGWVHQKGDIIKNLD